MEYKWKNNVIFSERNDLSKFLSDYYQSNPQRKIIYLLGKGFDPRMTNGLRYFLPNVKSGQIDCLLIDFPSTNKPPYQDLIDDNMKELLGLYSKYEVTEHSEVSVDFSTNSDLALRLLDQKLAKYNFDKYTDIIIYNPQNEMFSHFGTKRYNFKNETQLFKVIPHTSKNQKKSTGFAGTKYI